MTSQSLGTALMKGSCPRCRKGEMFKGKPFRKGQFDMYEECSCCGLKYEKEPGFFWGGLFINYIIVTGFVLVELAVAAWLNFVRDDLIFVIIPATVLVLFPLIFQFSRILFIYFFGGIKFDPNSVK